MNTTYNALNARAAKFVASLPESDPLVHANKLIDAGTAAVDAGDFELADSLFDLAGELI